MSNILCISKYDNGQQLQCIAESLRKYTEHSAIHINIKQSYLDYSADVKLSTVLDYKKLRELMNVISRCDFFIFSEILPSDIKHVLDCLHVYNKINPSNTIIRVGGSNVRSQSDKYLLSWIRDGWVLAGLHHDWSLISGIGRIFQIPTICPVDKIDESIPTGDDVGIAFSPTKKAKGVDEFVRVLNSIKNEHPHVFGHPIIGEPWRESISIKRGCKITFDQFMLDTYANSAVESMYLGHVVLSNIGNYTRFCYPDLPIISVSDETELHNELEYVLDHSELIKEVGDLGREFVLKHHSPKVVAEKLNYLIKHIEGL
jgi:glycosyltransferase involved in cell wall biosynthesis